MILIVAVHYCCNFVFEPAVCFAEVVWHKHHFFAFNELFKLISIVKRQNAEAFSGSSCCCCCYGGIVGNDNSLDNAQQSVADIINLKDSRVMPQHFEKHLNSGLKETLCLCC